MTLLWLLLGCSDEPDADRYYRLTTGSGDPAERIAACTGLSSESMVSDCQLTIARESDDMPALCPLLSAPVWRSECYFMAAERLQKTDPEAAGALCAEAEHFRSECVQHMWQGDLRALTRHGSRAFSTELPRAIALYQRWEALSEDSDMEVRFWRMFYTAGFQRARFLDPTHCAPLPGDHQVRCRQAAAALYTRQLSQIARFPRALRVLCGLDPVSAASAAATRVPELQAVPTPELDPVVVSVHERLCEDGQPRPDAGEIEIRLPGFEE